MNGNVGRCFFADQKQFPADHWSLIGRYFEPWETELVSKIWQVQYFPPYGAILTLQEESQLLNRYWMSQGGEYLSLARALAKNMSAMIWAGYVQ
jgi:hypothetical protein